MGELSGLNAARVLKMAYEVLERAADQGIAEIDSDFIFSEDIESALLEHKDIGGIHDAPTKDLMQEAK